MLVNFALKLMLKVNKKKISIEYKDKYYPRFGFSPASKWGIKAPFAVQDESFMAGHWNLMMEVKELSQDGIDL